MFLAMRDVFVIPLPHQLPNVNADYICDFQCIAHTGFGFVLSHAGERCFRHFQCGGKLSVCEALHTSYIFYIVPKHTLPHKMVLPLTLCCLRNLKLNLYIKFRIIYFRNNHILFFFFVNTIQKIFMFLLREI